MSVNLKSNYFTYETVRPVNGCSNFVLADVGFVYDTGDGTHWESLAIIYIREAGSRKPLKVFTPCFLEASGLDYFFDKWLEETGVMEGMGYRRTFTRTGIRRRTAFNQEPDPTVLDYIELGIELEDVTKSAKQLRAAEENIGGASNVLAGLDEKINEINEKRQKLAPKIADLYADIPNVVVEGEGDE